MWTTIPVHDRRDVPTMISLEERRYLTWMGRSVWSGAGQVVEIGPWLGGSTICLAGAMKATGHPCEKQLHVIDDFIWRDFMASRASLPLEPGESFLPFFIANTADFADIIVPHTLSLPDDPVVSLDENAAADGRNGRPRSESGTRSEPLGSGGIPTNPVDGPVEILYVDGAKSWRAMRYLFAALGDHLIPRRSYIVLQDYKYWGAYWVPLLISRLSEWLEPVHNVLDGGTVTFRLRSAIPQAGVERIEKDVTALDIAQSLHVLQSASQALARDGDAPGAAAVMLSKVRFLCHMSQPDLAVEEFKRIERNWPLLASRDQLERARGYLAIRCGYNIRGTAISRVVRHIQRAHVFGRLSIPRRQFANRMRRPRVSAAPKSVTQSAADRGEFGS